MANATVNSVLRSAASQIGVREGRDKNGNWNNRVKYTTWYADKVKNDAFLTSAWCAIFVSWVAQQAGILGNVIPLHAWTPSGLAWFRKNASVDRGKNAKPGDVFYVYYPSQGRVAHVGFVESVSGGYITTIEGNTNTSGSSQGNGVYRLRRKITNNLYFCHPRYSTAPSKPPTTSVPKSNPPSTGNSKPRIVGTVSVSALKSARYTDPPKPGEPLGKYADQVFTLETALARTGWIRQSSVDGHYGTSTVGNGSSGIGGATGFQKKHSGTRNPDGWLGKKELTLLFKLAKMSTKVVD